METLELEKIVSKRNPQAQVRICAYLWGGREILHVWSPSSEIDRGGIFREPNRHFVWEYVIKHGTQDQHFAPGTWGSRCKDFTLFI